MLNSMRVSGYKIINIGTGKDISIADLAVMIKVALGYTGTIEYNNFKPDGTMQKVLDIGRVTAMGWKAKYSLEEAIKMTYSWFTSYYKILSEQ